MSPQPHRNSHQRGVVVKLPDDERPTTPDGTSVSPTEVSEESVVYRCADCGRLHVAPPTWPQPDRDSAWLGRLLIVGLSILVGAGVAAGYITHALAAAAAVVGLPLWTVVATRIAGTFTQEFRQLRGTKQFVAVVSLGVSALPGFVLIHALPAKMRRRLPLTELPPASRAVLFDLNLSV